MVLDIIDFRILKELQIDGRINNNTLANRIGLSPSTCLRRVKHLEALGVISRYAAIISPEKVGLSITVYARIWLKSQDAMTINNFAAAVKTLPEIVECHLMAGDCDSLLRIIAADLDAYRKFLIKHLTEIEGIQSIKTEIPMQQIKQTSALPL
ncbi:Lrp/AsnC family transcriptional regulator [Enterobacter hormaechei subsp. xiangfangensis]